MAIILIPSCSDTTISPDQSLLSLYVQPNLEASPFPMGELPNRDTVKRDTTDKRRDTLDKKRDTVKKQVPIIFNDLLIRLQLNSTQKIIVERLLSEHRSCIEKCTLPLREAEREIQKRARIAEEQIKKAFIRGEITRTQARERLAELKRRVNLELRNTPVRKSVQECIKSCDSTFISHLERIISPEQRKILSTWLEQKSKRVSIEKRDTVVVKKRV
jgi:hypothetical protein